MQTENEFSSTGDYKAELYRKYVSSGQAPANSANKGSHTYLLRLIRNHMPPDKDALIVDLGCGSGQFVELCRQAGYRNIVGIDVSPEQVALAQARGLSSAIVQGDLFKFLDTSAAGSYDSIVAFDVLEHLTKDQAVRFFKAAHRALGASGQMVVHVPNGRSPFVGAVLYGDFTHETAYTSQSMQQLAIATGFRGACCYEDAPITHGFKSLVRAYIWALLRMFLRIASAAETGVWSHDNVWTRNMLVVIDR